MEVGSVMGHKRESIHSPNTRECVASKSRIRRAKIAR